MTGLPTPGGSDVWGTQLNAYLTERLTFSGAKLTKSATQSITQSVETAVTFDGETFDTDNYHSTSSNTSRLTIPTTSTYLIGGSLRLDSLAQDKRVTCYLLKNGTFDGALGYTRMTNSAAGESVSMPLTTVAQLTAGDYVELGVFQTDTTARNVSTTANGTSFWIVRLAL